mgnify:CR=1 FL=1
MSRKCNQCCEIRFEKDFSSVEVAMQKYHHILLDVQDVMKSMMGIGKNVIDVFKRFTLKNEF